MRHTLFLLLSVALSPCRAEVTLDGSLGHGTPQGVLTPTGTGEITVTAGMGIQRGGNLFHSFGHFDVDANQAVIFNGQGASGPVSAIIGRITGGTAHVDGALRVDFPGQAPDLYLLNPAGIVFGRNASVDLTGSLYLSTAHYLRFNDGTQLPTTAVPPPILTSAPVSAFGFLANTTPQPVNLHIDRNMNLQTGKALAIVGGDISIEGKTNAHTKIQTSRGDIRIVSLGAASGVTEIPKAATVPDLRGPIGSQGTVTLRNVELQVITGIDSRSTSNTGNPAEPPLLSGGGIKITAARLFMEKALIRIGALGLRSQSGDMVLTLDQLHLASGSSIVSDLGNGTDGKAGDVHIRNDSGKPLGEITIAGKSAIISNNQGSGRGANIEITTRSLTLTTDGKIKITGSGAQSGDLYLQLQDLNMLPGTQIDTESQASSGGNIFIHGTDGNQAYADIVTIRGANSSLIGHGNISIRTRNLTLDGRATIASRSTGNRQPAEINIQATDAITLMNGSAISSKDENKKSGQITLFAKNISIDNAFISTEAVNNGAAGDVVITADSIMLRGANASINANASSSGVAGKIFLHAAEINLQDNAIIGASNRFGSGAGGSVTITGREANANTVRLLGGGRISTKSLSTGDAGNIEIHADTLQIAGNNSEISASTRSARQGGNITIAAKQITLANHGKISATTEGTGHGGSIRISTVRLDMDTRAIIEARSTATGVDTSTHPEAGKSGRLDIDASEGIQVRNGAAITVETRETNADRVVIKAGKLLRIDRGNITTSVAGGNGSGGDIYIVAKLTVLDNHSEIVARAIQGNGGNIGISTDLLLRSPDSVIDASSRFGQSGVVDIKSPDTNAIRGLSKLPGKLFDAGNLLRPPCAARHNGLSSSLAIRGQSSPGSDPRFYLPTFYYAAQATLTRGIYFGALSLGCQ